MPKLTNRPPKYAKFKNYAVTFHNGKRIYLGLYGSPESHTAYARFLAERRLNPDLVLPRGEANVAVCELAAGFLDHAKATLGKPNYTHYRIAIIDLFHNSKIPIISVLRRRSCSKFQSSRQGGNDGSGRTKTTDGG